MTRHTILQVIPELQTGGAERTTVDIASALVASGDRALVASAGGRLVSELTATGARHVTLPLAAKSPFAMWRNACALKALIRSQGVDLVHARSRAPAWSALWAASTCDVPFVTTYHGIYGQTNAAKAFYNSVMARGDAVIANSRYTADLIARRHPFARDRTTVIPRGSDLAALAPEAVSAERRRALAERWGLAGDAPVILNLARLTGWKGQMGLVDALARLAETSDARWTAILAGDDQGRGDYTQKLRARIAGVGLEGRIRIVGHCDDVPAALALADLAVVASIEPEAFGRAAVEAQAARVPVIATDLGAAPETVLTPPEVAEDRRTGWRVLPGDTDAMAHAIGSALALEQSAREALTARAAAHVTELYSLEAMCARTLAVYDRLLAEA
ncbi:glycosyltransferase family 4 protein [Stappia sp. ES.058]|uniref:glycosyltransferase family 4 protein n=1 Tax=Stappia sp. ES.058 TaxID=1881061 RepID=UPI00087D07B9|nr:glycosyltransferase family 4 protein [Stappia sp. ES.058]SDT88208.1 Glycosyltransferase involved in cell wall bisynthesis [Stappia sp. ES.058]